MRRKLVKQGRNALTVTLPAEWTAKYGMKAGDDVEVEEKGSSIIFNSQGMQEEGNISINTKKFAKMLNRIVGATYKAGYDKVEFLYDEPDEVSIIQEVIGKTCIGFEITEQTKNKIEVRTLLKTDPKEFEVVLRRCFLTLISIGEDSLKAIKAEDEKEMQKVILRDVEVNKYSDFCRRIINKGTNLNYKRLAPLYAVVEQLEKIGDMYKDCVKVALSEKIRLGKETEHLYNEVNKYLMEMYHLFYSFDVKKMDDFIINKERIDLEFSMNLQNIRKEESRIFFSLNYLANSIYDLNGSIATLNI